MFEIIKKNCKNYSFSCGFRNLSKFTIVIILLDLQGMKMQDRLIMKITA